jgi:lipopolysaccharide transport system permease protein
VHQLPVLVIVGFKFGYLMHIHLGEAVIGFVLVVLNISWFALAFAALCARFRDMKQILASLIQLLFFLSPVLWIPNEMKGLGGRLLALNPIVHMLDVLRGPLIAEHFHLHSVLFLLVMGVAGWAFTLVFLAKVRRRIVHYV